MAGQRTSTNPTKTYEVLVDRLNRVDPDTGDTYSLLRGETFELDPASADARRLTAGTGSIFDQPAIKLSDADADVLVVLAPGAAADPLAVTTGATAGSLGTPVQPDGIGSPAV